MSEQSRRRGRRPFNAIKNCVLCLYRVGLGFTTIAKLTWANKALCRKWVIKAGLKRAPRKSTPFILPAARERRDKKTAFAREQKLKAQFLAKFLEASRVVFIGPERVEREKLKNRARAVRAYHRNPERGRLNAKKVWERKKNDAEWRKKKADQVRRWKKENPEKRRETHRKWYAQNRHQLKVYRARQRQKPSFKLLENLRNRLRKLVRGKRQHGSQALCGCTREQLVGHLQAQFAERMTWENYGSYWVVDHIIPCAAFNLADHQEQRRCFHYANLRPLTKRANELKNDKIINAQQSLLMPMGRAPTTTHSQP